MYIYIYICTFTSRTKGRRARAAYSIASLEYIFIYIHVFTCTYVHMYIYVHMDLNIYTHTPAERRAGGQEEHVLLDVWSIKQGAMRLQTLPFAVIMIAFMGLYFCVSSILNYNAIDADQVIVEDVCVCARKGV